MLYTSPTYYRLLQEIRFDLMVLSNLRIVDRENDHQNQARPEEPRKEKRHVAK